MTGIVRGGALNSACATGRRAPTFRRASVYTPTILLPYARRSKSLDTLIPILYLSGVSTRRLRGGAGRLARQGYSWLVGYDHRAAEGRLGR